MPASQNAIRLMTFHSSKGLEFPAVLIPFGDWEIVKTSKNSNFLWCQSTMSPLDEMELLPVNMSKSLEDTVFIHDYLREKALLYVDNINLLYVAFTRAIDLLCVFVPDNGEDSVKNSTSSLIINSLKKQDFSIENVDFPALQIPDFYQMENAVFEYGEFPVNKRVESVQNDLNMNRNEYPVRVISDVTKQVITSFDYFQEGAGNLTSRLNLGTIMHELFQNIKTAADIDHALLKLNIEGKITRDDMSQLKQLLVEAMDDPKAKEWFTVEWEIKNEASILLPDGTLHRPDRVMIRNKKATVVDYKFGDEEKPSYQSQVARYMRYLRQMGYTDIEGYLWYVSQKKIVPVVVGVEQGRLF
jgi:ATP-dependent exoDNAse (exonuclease V) beta subunit